MKIARVIYGEEELRADGTVAKVVQMMSPYDVDEFLDNGSLDSAYVEGLDENSIIGEGSIILTPEKNYIAWADNSFAAQGAAYEGEAPTWYDDGSKDTGIEPII